MSLPPLTFNAWLRYDLIERILRGLTDVGSVLEIGAGEGALGARLASRYDYVGLEPDPTACEEAHKRLARVGRGTVVCGDLSHLDPGTTFDLVCAFEVLEHIEDDAGTLRGWRERLRPGGWLLLSVPAHPDRWGAADRMAGHFRRYEPATMATLLAGAGFTDARTRSYGFPLGYALEFGRNVLARRTESKTSLAERTAASGRWFQPFDGLGWFTRGTTAPFRLLQRPFAESNLGTGLVVVARRAA